MSEKHYVLEDLRRSHPEALEVISKAEGEIAKLCNKQVALICYCETEQ